MKLYLIRHGESTANAKKMSQDHTPQLSDNGHIQAQSVANRFVSIPIDIIMSSTYIRAAQTAEYIQKRLQKEIIFTDLLREIKRPTEVIGRSWEESFSKNVNEQIKTHMYEKDWHYSDEENFFDLKLRAKKFLDYLSTRHENNIAAVSHGLFIKVLVASIVFEEAYDPDIYISMDRNMRTKNTGVTICEQTENHTWRLVSWNDHAHLE